MSRQLPHRGILIKHLNYYGFISMPRSSCSSCSFPQMMELLTFLSLHWCLQSPAAQVFDYYLFFPSWSTLHDCIDDDNLFSVVPSVIGFKCIEFIRRNHIYRNVIEESILNREQRKKIGRQIQKCFVSFANNSMWTLIPLAKNDFFSFMYYTCFNDNHILIKVPTTFISANKASEKIQTCNY